MKKLFFSFLIILIIISVGIFFWWQIAISPVSPSDKSQQVFVVGQGENVRSIGDKLEKAGLIRSATAFFIWAKWQKIDNKIQSGDFRLSPSQSLTALTQNLTHGSLDYWLTIIPGKRANEIAEILKEKAPNYDPSWQQKLAENEGYLFPDSYLIPTGDSIDDIIALTRKNFDKKYASLGTITTPQNKIVTVASLVEREAQFPDDQKLVASVIYNRLQINMALQLDATVQYAIGYDQKEQTWWKKNVTADDLQINSPYNTRLNPGLPPTPICNPGISALDAAAHPANSDYLYYISDRSGHLHFAKTLEQHTANIQKYNVQ